MMSRCGRRRSPSLVFRIESTFKCSGVYSFNDMVEVFVKVSPLIMRMYPSLKSVDEYMADWGAMGVDVSRHTKLRFACFRPTSSREPQAQEG
mmetsp:Transcript_16688/g.32907  ORF Transcript_16688/g.32907 Transcript_16688/m.32907 type:complete len:92 (-) Transcript_16688:69-344(-)